MGEKVEQGGQCEERMVKRGSKPGFYGIAVPDKISTYSCGDEIKTSPPPPVQDMPMLKSVSLTRGVCQRAGEVPSPSRLQSRRSRWSLGKGVHWV